MKKSLRIAAGIALAAALVCSVFAFAACGGAKSYTMSIDDMDDYIAAEDAGQLPMVHNACAYSKYAWTNVGISEVSFTLTISSDNTYTLVEVEMGATADTTADNYYRDEYTATGTWTSSTDDVYVLGAATSVTRTFVMADTMVEQSGGSFGQTGTRTVTGDTAASHCPGCTATVSGSSVAFTNSTAAYSFTMI